MIKVGILVISDKASRGERKDKSGPIMKEMIKKLPAKVSKYKIIPDKREEIKGNLINWVDKLRLNLILTSGGTGIGARDVTPEATKEVIEKEVPGFVEAMRIKGLEKTPFSMLSRALVGVRKKSLIVNLPG
ncbi:MogA/MoaB family molybdenum cofactor biosynthesis protein, partial [bacterium]|nr:MogA/MoaB family molybdenum cofactor biosynthesis protein [bacterium]